MNIIINMIRFIILLIFIKKFDFNILNFKNIIFRIYFNFN